MLKKEIYPKTPRIKSSGVYVCLTEKLDGSNLVFFKKNNKLHFAQRNTIFSIDEIEENKDKLYKGLYAWLLEHKDTLESELHDNSAICGEWLGMGKCKYTIDEFDKKWYMFAKANIDDEFNLYDLKYDHDLFIYPFLSQEIPLFIGVVPIIAKMSVLPNKEHLDSIYEKYLEKVNRNVEGIVISCFNHVTKYVRMKNGKLVEYCENDHKGE